MCFFLLQVYKGQTRIKRFIFTFQKAVQNLPPKLAGKLSLDIMNIKIYFKIQIKSESAQVKGRILVTVQVLLKFLQFIGNIRDINSEQAEYFQMKRLSVFAFTFFGHRHDIQI